jgi:peptidyl-prolyl cis-trans isomerase SurA
MKKSCMSFFLILIISLFIIDNSFTYAEKKQTPKVKKSSSTSDNKLNNEVLATVGNEKITYSDLDRAYKKNMSRKETNLYEVSKDSIMDFLNLYLNYRLKVNDALGRGFDKDSSVLAEISQNRKVLAESYFYEKKLVNPKVDELMKYRDFDYQIAIIMFQLPSTPNPDTTSAYIKAKRTLELLKAGANFENLARDSSSDKETASRSGIVTQYLTAGKVIRNIEDVIFKLNPGQFYPDLVRTKYGYFIIKLVREEPRVEILIRHILIATKDKSDPIANSKADSLINLLKSGVDFAKLAKENSDDKKSAEKGGLLGGYYSRSSGFDETGRNLLPEMEDAAFALKDGETSGKVHSEYGIHIIRRDSSKKFDPEKDREELKLQYKRQYFENDKVTYLDSLRKQYGFLLNNNTYDAFLAGLDTNVTNLDTAWTKKIPHALLSEVLYSFIGKNTTVGEFVDMMQKKSELRGLGTNSNGLQRAIDRITSPLVFDAASQSLEKEYPDFAQLLREFRDGILLFKVEDQEVWTKLKFDTTLAKKYWDTTQTKYKTEPTYDINEIYVLSDSLAKELYKQIKSGTDFDTLAKQFTQRAGYREKKGHWGKVIPKDNKLAKLIEDKFPEYEKLNKAYSSNGKEGIILEPMPYEKGFSVVEINSFAPVRQKTFDEAIPDFAPAFQDQLQKQLTESWLKELRKKFNVKIYADKIDKIIGEHKAN